MRTAIFSPSYLEGTDPQGNNRLDRNIAWARWYKSIAGHMGIDELWLADNASSYNRCALIEGFGVTVHRFSKHLSRGEGENPYPYCWRALWFVRELVESNHYDRIIFCDTDTYVVSESFANYVRDRDTGWWSVWCPKHSFPEASFHVLNRDAFPLFMQYTSSPYTEKYGLLMEHNLRFTDVMHCFDCDRYGESRAPQTNTMDLYGQRPLDIPLAFTRRTNG
jgi:hypothetical protein